MRSWEVDENIVRNREKVNGKDTSSEPHLSGIKSEIRKKN